MGEGYASTAHALVVGASKDEDVTGVDVTLNVAFQEQNSQQGVL